jgi:hypothetical protein
MSTDCSKFRCEWETDILATSIMETNSSIHRTMMAKNNSYNQLANRIKEGDTTNDMIYYAENPYYTIDSFYDIEETKDNIKSIVSEFYDMTEDLSCFCVFCEDIDWCVYTARQKLSPNDNKMVIPCFFRQQHLLIL